MTRRYSPDPFPAYQYLPGQTPHPKRSPKGHSYGKRESDPILTDPADWKTTHAYLFGIDLFNHEYFWEAHETWEGIWKGLEMSSSHAQFLQGIIQVAAACLKYKMENADGAGMLARSALERLRKAQKALGNVFMGVDLGAFVSEVERSLAPAFRGAVRGPLPEIQFPRLEPTGFDEQP